MRKESQENYFNGLDILPICKTLIIGKYRRRHSLSKHTGTNVEKLGYKSGMKVIINLMYIES